MKKKGFTLIELLVVIAIIAMLMAILMPALGRVKRLAQRLVCGTNLKGLGTATLIYANENEDEFPIAGGRGAALWSDLTDNWGADSDDARDTDRDNVTIAASQFLLVKYADVDPKVFICGSSDEKEYIMSDTPTGETPPADDLELVELWDFGEAPYEHVSYSYHFQYRPNDGADTAYTINGMSAPGMAIMADKNPFFDTDFQDSNIGTADAPPESLVPDDGNHTDYVGIICEQGRTTDFDSIAKEYYQLSNSGNHLREGQNVLFLDGHTAFEKRSDVGVDNDNIYTVRKGRDTAEWTSTPGMIRAGAGVSWAHNQRSGAHKSDEDNWLVHDFED